MLKKKKLIILPIVLIIAAAVLVFTQSAKWSERSFSAVVRETVIQPDGEIRLIVERTAEIYSDSLNALGISEGTKLIGMGGQAASIEEFEPGDVVQVTLKDSFVEETPFYYPTVYQIKRISSKRTY